MTVKIFALGSIISLLPIEVLAGSGKIDASKKAPESQVFEHVKAHSGKCKLSNRQIIMKLGITEEQQEQIREMLPSSRDTTYESFTEEVSAYISEFKSLSFLDKLKSRVLLYKILNREQLERFWALKELKKERCSK